MYVPLILNKNLERALRSGHPWIFRDALDHPPRLKDGTLVEVRSRDRRPLAVGFWDARSAIAVRVLDPHPLPDWEAALRSRMREAMKRRRDRLDPARTNAFRWVHGEADLLPGLHVDLYDDIAGVRFDGEGARAVYRSSLAETAQELSIRAAADRLSGKPLFGGLPPAPFVVRENGILFEVLPGTGGKGGLYLDQRENREEVERRADGRTVLNLFGYTGAFSMYAARGGARSTDTVDVSGPALKAAKANFRHNGLSLKQARFVAADAFDFLERSSRRRWDLVISDPPSFAPSQQAKMKALRAYTRLHRLAAAVTEPGGLLCAASCSSHVHRRDFLATVEAGARAAGRRFQLLSIRGAGFDHPVLKAFPEGDYLKFAIGRVM